MPGKQQYNYKKKMVRSGGQINISAEPRSTIEAGEALAKGWRRRGRDIGPGIQIISVRHKYRYIMYKVHKVILIVSIIVWYFV